MHSTRMVCVICGIGLILSACQNRGLTEKHAGPVLNQTGTVNNSRFKAREADFGNTQTVLPSDELALIQLLFESNPSLQAMYYKRDQANIGSRAIQSLPPTSIQIAPVGDMVETAAGSMEASIAIMQPLRPFGMIRAQTEQAKQRYHVELAQVDALRLKKATQLRQAILERKLASDSLRALQQMLELVDKMHLVVQTRVASGGTQRNELLEVEIQQTRLQQLQRDWQARLKRSENNITFMFGQADKFVLPDLIVLSEPPITRRAVKRLAEHHHPLLQKAQAQLSEQEAAYDVVRASGNPQLSVGLQYAFIEDEGLSPVANGDDQWSLSVGIKIPLNRSYEHARREAMASAIAEKTWNIKDIEQDLQRNLQNVMVSWESSHEQWRKSYEEILPKTKERFDLLRLDYESGKGSYLLLIDAWKDYLLQVLQERQYYYQQFAYRIHVLEAVGVIALNEEKGAADE